MHGSILCESVVLSLFLKVVKLENKGQLERYEILNLPMSKTVSELKDFLLTNYEEEISPVTDCSFLVGIIGKRCTKCKSKEAT